MEEKITPVTKEYYDKLVKVIEKDKQTKEEEKFKYNDVHKPTNAKSSRGKLKEENKRFKNCNMELNKQIQELGLAYLKLKEYYDFLVKQLALGKNCYIWQNYESLQWNFSPTGADNLDRPNSITFSFDTIEKAIDKAIEYKKEFEAKKELENIENNEE